MKFAVECPHCGFAFRAGGKQRGKEMQCPECTRSLVAVPRTGLDAVGLGLLIHYAGLALSLLGAAVFVIGLAVFLCGRVAGDPNVERVGRYVALAGDLALLLALTVDLASVILSLWLPDAAGRGLLGGSLAARAAAVGVAVLCLVADEPPAWALLLLAALAAAAWVLWVCFARRLALYLGRREMAVETLDLLGSALKTVLPVAVLLGLTVAVVAIVASDGPVIVKIFLLAVLGGMLLGVLRFTVVAAFNTGAESPVLTLLYPTAVPFSLRYLSLLGTLRLLVRRQA
jgi:hypothetical protein